MNTRSSLIAVTSLTATFVAMCAAVFSVTGIAKLFAGAAWSAAIMASSLELGKIVSISFLYQYWKQIPRALKLYLNIAAMVLMVITSAGIYGYLSSAYAKVAATPLQMSAEVQTIENRVISVGQDIDRKNQRLSQLITLRSQQESRLDQLVSKSTTGSGTTIRSAQTALANADKDVNVLQKEISALSAQRDSLTGMSISKQVQIDTNAEIGTFVYIAKMFGVSLDTVVKWFTLIIVLVFDPLAVALVIAVNFLIKNKDENVTTAEEKTDNSTDVTNKENTDEEPYKVFVPEPQTATPETNPLMPDKMYHWDENEENLPFLHRPLTEPPTVVPDPTEPQEIPEMALVRPTEPQPDQLYYTAGDFDWSNRGQWENDPLAVKYYNERIKPRLQ